MANRGRFVLDTNVIVSALLMKKSVARDALDRARAEGEILLSLTVIEELHDVLSRPAFDRYIDEEDRLRFLSLFIKEATLVEISEQIQECRDPKDDKFLELAVNGNATLIISGDKDLQVLNPFRNISIFSPREFLDTEL
ncbi:MAG: putative toxin-antitoxin system toxin component, PIN family [Anaerolineales bacterium]|nr:putative toxin-antitoxin system toxin component, PIN family [Anaerolineales bacterium]MCB9146379.1 putative toxin-antitoxin system toxin component, PIN family [Anaerolineales bacterium]